MILIDQGSNRAIADTVSAVFRSPAFRTNTAPSLADLILRWIVSFVRSFFRFAAERPAIALVIRIALWAALALLVARVAYTFYLQRAPARMRHKYGASSGTDWLTLASRLASEGSYTEAAHALYLALVAAAARRGLVAIHDSKTTGDYLREIRRRASPDETEQFRTFTRSYETVIYGIGSCDAARYDSLRAIAGALLGHT